MSCQEALQRAYEPSRRVLQQLNRLERSSPNFPDQLTSIFSTEEYQNLHYSREKIEGRDQAWLIEYLGNVLDTLDPAGPAYRTCIRGLQTACYWGNRLPRSYMLDVSSLLPIAYQPPIGLYETVYEGLLNGSKVHVKKIKRSISLDWRISPGLLCEEVVNWKHLMHPNVVPFLGITNNFTSLISAWITGAELSNYITLHPNTNRLDLLIGIANGLGYLHSRHVTHGDLGGPNIIVDNSGRPCITGFGLTSVVGPVVHSTGFGLTSVVGPVFHSSGCARWAEPNVLDIITVAPPDKRDLFSFAMVTVEVFIGQVPFFPESDDMARSAIMSGQRPERPIHTDLTDGLWALMEQCWDVDRDKRPKISVVLGHLHDCRNNNRALIPVPPPVHVNWFSQITGEILDLTDQVASVALFGSIGVGKSFVAHTVLDHDRTKAKFGENRHFIRCDDLPNSLESFIQRLADAIHTDTTKLESCLRSSPPLILFLDGVDSVLDSLDPEEEEIHSRIEEFGSYEHVCLITTSRIYPDIHGFHRVEVPTPPEDGARDIFYTLCKMDRSAATDTLIAKLDSHPFSIELVARCIRENRWDEEMLLKAWGDQNSGLRKIYYQSLKDAIEPVFCSPRIKTLGTTARDVLGAIASFQSGIGEHQLEGLFHGRGGAREVVDVLCKFSLVYRRDGILRMLSPLQFYFLEPMIVYAEREEVIRWGPDCMPAPAWCPYHTGGPPDDWLMDPSPLRPTIPQPRKSWIRRLPQFVKKRLLALFGRRIAPIIRIDLQDPVGNFPDAQQENPTDVPPTTAQDDRANVLPSAAQEDSVNTSHAVQEVPADAPPVLQEDPANTLPTTEEEDLVNVPPIAPQQQIPLEMTPYELDWS